MIEAYLQHESERKSEGIPARPLDPQQVSELCALLENPPVEKEPFLLQLFRERVSPGVDPAAKVKAEFLSEIIDNRKRSPLISRKEAVRLLGTMLGGYNISPLIEALKDEELADEAVKALSGTILVYEAFDEVVSLSKTNTAAKKVIKSWANAEWFTGKAGVPETIKVKVYKVEGEINTDDFSPAGDAWSRPDIPLHALCHGQNALSLGARNHRQVPRRRLPGCFCRRCGGHRLLPQIRLQQSFSGISARIFRACPTRRRGGVIIGGVIAPIFFNTAQDSGALPLKADVTKMNTGDVIVINTQKEKSTSEDGRTALHFRSSPRIPLPMNSAPAAGFP